MTLQELIDEAYSGKVETSRMEAAAHEMNISLGDLANAFARSVAERFLSGELSWEYCDATMNSLFTWAYPLSLVGLPDFAFRVYTAFDEGEYIHKGDSSSTPEARTAPLLKQILGAGNA